MFRSPWLLALLLSAPLAVGFGSPAAAQQVVVSEVTERQLATRQSFVADVNPNRRAVIGSAVDGRVVDYPIRAGQAVAARQPITQLLTRLIEIELEGAKAELGLRRGELEELENGSRPEEIELARAQLEAAVAGRDYAEARLARNERLFRTGGGVSADELEQARSAALQAIAMVRQGENSLQLIEQGPRREQIAQARARLEMQAQIVAGLEERLDRYTIYSPFDGFVVAELTEKGAWVRQGDPVAEVAEIQTVDIEVNVPEASIRFVRVGMECTVRIDSLAGRTFPGRVAHIVPRADDRARTFPVRVQVDNPLEDDQHVLLPGMLAHVQLPVETPRTALLVPKDGLLIQQGRPHPQVMKVLDGKAEPVAVRLGSSLGGLIEVTPLAADQLSASDLIVVMGNERLRPGDAVEVSSRIDPEAYLDDLLPTSSRR